MGVQGKNETFNGSGRGKNGTLNGSCQTKKTYPWSIEQYNCDPYWECKVQKYILTGRKFEKGDP